MHITCNMSINTMHSQL